MKNKKIFFKNYIIQIPLGLRVWQLIRAITLLRNKCFRDLFLEVKKEDICLDLGANIGFASLVMWIKGVKHIYALEPNKEAFFELKKNLKGIRNITIFNMAISSVTKKQKLFLHNSIKKKSESNKILQHSQSSSLLSDKSNIGDCYYEVNSIKLKELFNKLLMQPNIIKCDIEGGEYIIYKDLVEVPNSHNIRKIFVECHSDKYPQYQNLHKDFIEIIKDNNLEKIIDTTWH